MATVAASDASSLTQNQLQPIVSEAIARWIHVGLNATTIQKLTQVQFVISDLSDSYLGKAEGNCIFLDTDAAGHGWFVDSTPACDEEFAPSQSSRQLRAVDWRALDQIDLLTVVEHELGHIVGFDDLYTLTDNLMCSVLGAGTRRNPYRDYVGAALT